MTSSNPTPLAATALILGTLFIGCDEAKVKDHPPLVAPRPAVGVSPNLNSKNTLTGNNAPAVPKINLPLTTTEEWRTLAKTDVNELIKSIDQLSPGNKRTMQIADVLDYIKQRDRERFLIFLLDSPIEEDRHDVGRLVSGSTAISADVFYKYLNVYFKDRYFRGIMSRGYVNSLSKEMSLSELYLKTQEFPKEVAQEVQGRLMAKAFEGSSPNKAVELLNSFKQEDRLPAIQELAALYGTHNAQDGLKWLETLNGKESSRASSVILTFWLQNDSRAASEWASSQLGSANQEVLVKGLVEYSLQHQDWEAAEAWIAKAQDGPGKQTWLHRLAEARKPNAPRNH